MNWYISTVISLFLFVGSLHAQSFEGTIDIKITNELTEEVSTIVWHQKTVNSRMDVSTVTPQISYEMGLLMEEGKDEMTMLINRNGNKSAYTTAVSKVKGQDEPVLSHEDIEGNDPEERNGFACEVLTVKNENGTVKYWLTSEIDLKLTAFPPLMRRANYYKYLLNNHPDMIPVFVQSYNAEGVLEYTQEILQVTASKVDDDLFLVPADYEQIGKSTISIQE